MMVLSLDHDVRHMTVVRRDSIMGFIMELLTVATFGREFQIPGPVDRKPQEASVVLRQVQQESCGRRSKLSCWSVSVQER